MIYYNIFYGYWKFGGVYFNYSQPKISVPPAAQPFFPEGSLVTDWYHGELRSALLETLNHDISFIMYYAPWDAECQEVRKEFDIAASFYYKQVKVLMFDHKSDINLEINFYRYFLLLLIVGNLKVNVLKNVQDMAFVFGLECLFVYYVVSKELFIMVH